MSSVVDLIRAETPERREQFILDVIAGAHGDAIAAAPGAWRGKFRKMASTPYSFYRGLAALFYADVARDDDPFAGEQTSRIWIHGDLHAENFGTYMNSAGLLVFDVNDFDEAYVGPFTWDLKRLVASLALIGYQKALADDEIRAVIATLARSYVAQVQLFAASAHTRSFALTLANAEGKLLEMLRQVRLKTRIGLLDFFTEIDGHERRFKRGNAASPLDSAMREKALAAYEQYLTTIPPRKRLNEGSYRVKDIVLFLDKRQDVGSLGSSTYYILLEGATQALENDILIRMKQAQPPLVARVLPDARVSSYFLHDGHRIAISHRALQAYADPWLGYTSLDGVGLIVGEKSPYAEDFSWEDTNELEDMLRLVVFLGQATAKAHCVSDVDSDQTLVPFSTDSAISAALTGREDDFVAAMVRFGEGYGARVRDDHRLFVDAFRNHRIPGI